MRAKERSESRELELICEDINAPVENLDVNKASQDDLESLPGVGPVTARRIIDGRPYKKIDDLVMLPGISSNGLNKIRPYLKEI
jgi:competence protein ComEA